MIIPHFITKVPDMSSPSFKRSCRQAKLDKYRPLSETLKMEKVTFNNNITAYDKGQYTTGSTHQ